MPPAGGGGEVVFADMGEMSVHGPASLRVCPCSGARGAQRKLQDKVKGGF